MYEKVVVTFMKDVSVKVPIDTPSSEARETAIELAVNKLESEHDSISDMLNYEFEAVAFISIDSPLSKGV